MSTAIHTIPLGIANTFIIKDRGTVLIDCGPPGKSKSFIRLLLAKGIKPEDIQLIIVTHGHWDHIGSAADIKEITGAKIAMHRSERDRLEKLSQPPLTGVGVWGKFLSMTMAAAMAPFIKLRCAEVDVVLDDASLSLGKYGIAGRIVYTPGHTLGSVSVLLDSGEAIVGDMAMNSFPCVYHRACPFLPKICRT